MPESFLHDFFDSLNLQTFKDFDVVVVNDGYEDFETVQKKYENLSIFELPFSDTPAKNREHGINYCLDQNYDVIIFGDSDDYFSYNRVELSLKMLIDWDIVVNDVSLFDESGVYEDKYVSHRVRNRTAIKHNFIQNKNIFGLSNTAVRRKAIGHVIFDENLVAVDWAFYKGLLRNGCTAIFTNEMITYYRQHSDNTIGLRAEKDKYYLWWEK